MPGSAAGSLSRTGALRDRLRLARLFLAGHPDLGAWMTCPTRTRLADLRRVRAWPLLS
jgi:hypothetical protein